MNMQVSSPYSNSIIEYEVIRTDIQLLKHYAILYTGIYN